jgi:hypothetical protein
MRVSRLTLLVSLIFLAVSTSRGDVTVRYKNDVKVAAGTQSNAVVSSKQFLPAVTVIRIKGEKAYVEHAPFTTVTDYDKQVITLLDPEHKQFASVYLKDYADEVMSIIKATSIPDVGPEAQKMFDSLKTNVSSRKTGRTDIILGIQAEEQEITLTIEMASPFGASGSNDPAKDVPMITLIRMVDHIWNAEPSEVDRVPALKELSRITSDQNNAFLLDPATGISKMFSQMPGLGKNLQSMMEQLAASRGVMLKTHVEMFSPMAAQAMQMMQAQDRSAGHSVDPAAPIMEMNMEATEISAALIDDSVFQIASDYHVASVPDLLRSILPAQQQTSDATSQAPAAPPHAHPE